MSEQKRPPRNTPNSIIPSGKYCNGCVYLYTSFCHAYCRLLRLDIRYKPEDINIAGALTRVDHMVKAATCPKPSKIDNKVKGGS